MSWTHFNTEYLAYILLCIIKIYALIKNKYNWKETVSYFSVIYPVFILCNLLQGTLAYVNIQILAILDFGISW